MLVVVMVVAAAAFIAVIVVMVVFMCFVLHVLHLFFQRVAVHRFLDLHAVELAPRSGDETGGGVELFEHLACGEYLALGSRIGAAHDYKVCVLDLIVEKLAEVAHIHAALSGVDHGDLCADGRALYLFHSARHVAELADA